jgi:hypothetical protein
MKYQFHTAVDFIPVFWNAVEYIMTDLAERTAVPILRLGE